MVRKSQSIPEVPAVPDVPELPGDLMGDLQAIQVMALAEGKDPLAVLLGRRGGLKGGKARAEALSPTRRREIAELAAKARWNR